jgi:prepilin-type N-terminal cleavage/methylation domain-containing protein
MKLYRQSQKGFSLIELVIVVVILGIITAIAIPRLSSGTRNAGEAALKADLQTIRNSVDWYYTEHHNTFPGVKAAGGSFGAANTEDSFVNQLIYYSNEKGEVSETKNDNYPLGPYLRGGVPGLPVGTNSGDTSISVVNEAGAVQADDSTGWVYSTITGQFIANCTEENKDGQAYSTY